MPASYRIDRDRGIVYSVATGVLTDDDLIAHQQRLAQDPDFKADFRQLFDTRGVTQVEVTPGALRHRADANPFGHGARRAVIAPGDVAFGLARLFQLTANARGHLDELHVFRSSEEARA